MGKMINEDMAAGYSPIEHVRTLLRKTSKLGVDPNSILRKCNLSFTLNDVESGKILCLNRPHFSTIVRSCLLTATDAFSSGDRQIMGRLDFDLMCYGCLQCSTLEEAIGRVIDILHLLHDSQGCLELHREGNTTAILEIRTFPAEPDWELIFVLNAFAVFHRLFSWLIGEELRDVEFATDFGPSARPDARLLSPYSALKFGCARNEMRFSADQLTRPIVKNHLDLAEFLKYFPFDSCLPQNETQCWADTVRAHYKTMIYRGQPLPTTSALAAALGISGAHVEAAAGRRAQFDPQHQGTGADGTGAAISRRLDVEHRRAGGASRLQLVESLHARLQVMERGDPRALPGVRGEQGSELSAGG